MVEKTIKDTSYGLENCIKDTGSSLGMKDNDPINYQSHCHIMSFENENNKKSVKKDFDKFF